MKYYVIAGEASGDLHGSHLLKHLGIVDAKAEFRCWGGDLMAGQKGVTLVKHYKGLAFMGFVEVVKNLRFILRNLSFCKQDILGYAPDVVIFIDYPGFNLRIAQWAKKAGFRTLYYIAPQVWAWKPNRVKGMMQSIDKLLVILPFEKEYFKKKWGWEVDYVGHPLVDSIGAFRNGRVILELNGLPIDGIKEQKPIVALLPGSRKQEIVKKLPIMLSMAEYFPNYLFVVAKAPGVDDEVYAEFLDTYQNVCGVRDQTYALLKNSKAALVTSGTATLETALFGVPEVVCYKTGWLSYRLGKMLVKVRFISLVNLIMGKKIVEELIQDDLNPEKIKNSLEKILHDAKHIRKLRKDYEKLWNLLSKGGEASKSAANIVWGFVNGH